MNLISKYSKFKAYLKSLRRKNGNGKFLAISLQAAHNFRKNCWDLMLLPGALIHFESKTAGKTLPELAKVVMTEFGGLLRPIQSPYELTRWIERIAIVKPKLVVEIGTAKGGTFFLMSRAADANATLISIDLPGGLYGGGYPFWKKPFFQHIIGGGKIVHFLRGNSHAASTVAELRKLLAGRPIDLLLIDGDHSYEGVKTDFYLYSPLVRPGGVIGFHDIVENRLDPDIRVSQFWNEIKEVYPAEEIIDPNNLGRLGIGLIVFVPLVNSQSLGERQESLA